MGFFNTLIGAGTKGLNYAPKNPNEESMNSYEADLYNQGANQADRIGGFQSLVSSQVPTANEKMLRSYADLQARGEDVGKLNQQFFNSMYEPALQRLGADYSNAERNLEESHNARGILGGTPEAYDNSLLGREFSRELGNVSKEAVGQSMQQNINAYNARTVEPQLAQSMFQQYVNPIMDSSLAQGAGQNMGTRLGYQQGMHGINTNYRNAGQDRLMGLVGAGMSTASAYAPQVGGSFSKLLSAFA